MRPRGCFGLMDLSVSFSSFSWSFLSFLPFEDAHDFLEDSGDCSGVGACEVVSKCSNPGAVIFSLGVLIGCGCGFVLFVIFLLRSP